MSSPTFDAMALADLYCLAGAPLLTTCLESPSYDDVTVEGILKELTMLLSFSGCGFKNFITYFEKTNAKEKTDEFTAALACLAAFCARLQDLLRAASKLARALQGQFQPNSLHILKQYEAKARSEGLNPSDKLIVDLLDTDKDADWSTDAMRRGKVDFTQGAKAMHEDQQFSPGPANNAAVTEPPSRKHGRNLTGYVKYNAPTEHADTSDETALGKAKKGASKRSTLQAPDPHSGKFATFAVHRPQVGASESAWSIWNSCKSCWGSENESLMMNNGVAVDLEHGTIRKESSVHISGIQEINDEKGDSGWDELPRRLQRFNRIRKRVPTGHPKLMKDSSEDALSALGADDVEESSEANEHLTQKSALTSAELPDDRALSGNNIAMNGRVSRPAHGEKHHPQHESAKLELMQVREFRVA